MKTFNHISKRLGLTVSLFLLAPTAVLAQTFTLKGTVKDDMGEGVIGATVKLVGTTNGVLTEILSGVSAGTEVLTDFNISGGAPEGPQAEQATNPFMPRPRGNNRNNNNQQQRR